MFQYTRLKPAQAKAKWANKLNESYGNLGFEKSAHGSHRMDLMGKLAGIKEIVDGGFNAKEKSLLESYNISGTADIMGMGPTTWPSDPGTAPGNQEGAWSRSNYKKGSGDVPSMIFGLAMNVAAYTVGFDLVNTIAVDTPSAAFQFLDSIYAGGKLSEAGNPPAYMKVSSKNLRNGFDYSSFVVGGFIFVKTKGADTAVQGVYMGKSFYDGSVIIKLDSTGTIAAGGAYTKTDALSVGDVFSDEIELIAGSSAVLADGTAVDAGEAKADYVETFREHVQGFTNSDKVTARSMDRATGEQGTRSVINLRLWSATLEMRTVEVLADITKTQLKDLSAYGIDGVAQLYKAGQNELIQSINDEIIREFTRLGVKNHAQLLAAQGLNLNLFIAPAGTTSKPLNQFGYEEFKDDEGNDRAAEFGSIPNAENNSAAENNGTRQRRVYSRLLAASGIIGTISRYGDGDVAIVNPQIAIALQDAKNFNAVPVENNLGSTGDLHFIGMINGIRIYKNPKWKWNDMRISVGRQGAEDQPGLKFFAYDLAQSVEVIDSSTYAPKLCITSRFAVQACGFHPEASYLTFVINSGFGQDTWV